MEGQFMALLSTEGSVPTPPGTNGSIMSRTFSAPAVPSRITFCYQLVTNDSPGFEDFLLAQLVTTAGTFTLATADNLAGSPAGGSRPPPAPAVSANVTLTPSIAPMTVTGVNILGTGLAASSSSITSRVCSSFPLPPEVLGTQVTLRFTVSDQGDAIVETAALIDDVRVQAQ
jgi:hypothetical protein